MISQARRKTGTRAKKKIRPGCLNAQIQKEALTKYKAIQMKTSRIDNHLNVGALRGPPGISSLCSSVTASPKFLDFSRIL